jgi:3-deoxy-manno-octulosonate cytidylyltransferase (CMP-KDO synthetase)
VKDVTIVIPARFASTRFPGKPLELIGSKTMIEYVYKACRGSSYNPQVIIATDDERILSVCKGFISNNDQALMTPLDIKTGTERVAFVAKGIASKYVLNIQGDEPMLESSIVDKLIDETINCEDNTPVATLAVWSSNIDDYNNPNVVKVVCGLDNRALYFSRSGIPGSKDAKTNSFLKHVGLYGFKRDFLLKIKDLKQGNLEQVESLEQLRVLENDYGIRVGIVDNEIIGLDTPEQKAKIIKILKEKGRLL